MDVLVPAVYSALSGDSTLDSLTVAVNNFRQPEDPKKMGGVVVVFTVRDAEDEVGLHGAAVNPEVEVSVWGYGPSSVGPCWQVAQRVSEIFLGGISLDSGGSTRWGEILGWNQIDQPNPETVLLRAEFRCRYWSSGRVTAVVAARVAPPTEVLFWNEKFEAADTDETWDGGFTETGVPTHLEYDLNATPPAAASGFGWNDACLELDMHRTGAGTVNAYLQHPALSTPESRFRMYLDFVLTDATQITDEGEWPNVSTFMWLSRRASVPVNFILSLYLVDDGGTPTLRFQPRHDGTTNNLYDFGLSLNTHYEIDFLWDLEELEWAITINDTELASGAITSTPASNPDEWSLGRMSLGTTFGGPEGPPFEDWTAYLDNFQLYRVLS